MNRILSLYNNVSRKTLRISKIFGIEGKKLLGPDDDHDALKDFDHAYEGSASFLETLHLEYQALLAQWELPRSRSIRTRCRCPTPASGGCGHGTRWGRSTSTADTERSALADAGRLASKGQSKVKPSDEEVSPISTASALAPRWQWEAPSHALSGGIALLQCGVVPEA